MKNKYNNKVYKNSENIIDAEIIEEEKEKKEDEL
mgnify:FL=1